MLTALVAGRVVVTATVAGLPPRVGSASL
jgi:hypothetical protein